MIAMKKHLLLFLIFSFPGNLIFGQQPHLNFSANYVYQYAPAWDEIIRTYNFSRSFNAHELNLFINGFEVSAGWRIILHNEKIELNPGISYQRFSSYEKNDGMKLLTSINSFNVHSNLTWNFGAGKFSPSWISLDPVFTLLNPSVRINFKEIQLDQTKKYHEYGPAFRLGFETGWKIPDARHKMEWKPFLRADWYPEAELYDYGSALNGSYIQDLKDWGMVWQFSAGVRIFFHKEEQPAK